MTREEAIEALNEIFDDSEFNRYESWYGKASERLPKNEDLVIVTIFDESGDTPTLDGI